MVPVALDIPHLKSLILNINQAIPNPITGWGGDGWVGKQMIGIFFYIKICIFQEPMVIVVLDIPQLSHSAL